MSWLSEVDKARRGKQEPERARRKFLDSELRKHDPMVRRLLQEVADYLKKAERTARSFDETFPPFYG